nr:cytochrome c oxidase subunit 2 [Artemidia motanka]
MLLHAMGISYVAHVVFEVINVGVLVFVFCSYVTLACSTNTTVRGIDMNMWIELIWLSVPSTAALSMLVRCIILQSALDPLAVTCGILHVIGNQWFWVIGHASASVYVYMLRESTLSIGDIRSICTTQAVAVPMGSIARVVVSSMDVIHSFTLVGLGIKGDVVPGRCNTHALTSIGCGSVQGQCSEICGAFHGYMPVVFFFF